MDFHNNSFAKIKGNISHISNKPFLTDNYQLNGYARRIDYSTKFHVL